MNKKRLDKHLISRLVCEAGRLFLFIKVCIMGNMAKKRGRPSKKDKEKEEKMGWLEDLGHGTKHSILAIFSFGFALLLVLAAFGKAGQVGEQLYGVFDFLFGAAFFLAPLVFFLAGVSFLLSFRRRLMVTIIGGGMLMLVSSLALFETVLGEKAAGYVGSQLASPLLTYFDFWASLVILMTLFVISILLMLNISLKPHLVFRKKEETPETSVQVSVLEGTSKTEETVREESKEGEVEDLGDERREETREENSPEEKSPFFMQQKRIQGTSAVSKAFVPPPLDLLEDDKGKPNSGDIKANANIIKRTLQNFGVTVEMGEVSIGPSITQYTLRPAEGVKLARILALHNDLSLTLAAHPIRIEAPIPGKSLVGIEIPNRSIALVGMRSVLAAEEFKNSNMPLVLGFGRDVSGKTVYTSLEKMPHLLVAGSTGSGKSVAIHAMMMSLLYRNPPERLRFLMIDPKRVELTAYSGIPHMLTPVITDPKKAILALKWAVGEMERRYELIASARARDINSYQSSREARENPMPYIVIIIDELADIMSAYPREMEATVVRLAQMSRAVGIHLIVSTQRPSVEVITGLIKANITSRMAFQVASQVDSRTILDMAGSEKLLGNGDMLYLAGDTDKPRRIQGAFVSESEVRKVVQYLEEKYASHEIESIRLEPEGVDASLFGPSSSEDDDDQLYPQAEEIIIQAGKASASYLQRRLRIGYARAARLLDFLESRGVVGPADGSKPREVLVKPKDNLET